MRRLREVIREGIDPRLIHWASTFRGGKGGAPPPPDYSGAAREQAASSKEITTQQTWANRPDQYTPWGSSTWGAAAGVDPSTGQPITKFTQQESLNPQLQGALNEQLALQSGRSQLAGGFMGRVADEYQQPFDWTNIPGMSGTPQARLSGTYTQGTNEPAFAGERQRIEQGLFERMAPQHQAQEQQSRTMLANQGLTPGSEAYNTELQRLHEQQAGERFNAMQTGGAEQQRMQQMMLGQQQQAYGQEIGANAQNFGQMTQMADYQNKIRQQAIAEQAMQRGMSLNEMNALLTGQQVSTPQMPSFQNAQAAQPLQALAAAQAQGQYGIDAAKIDAQSSAGLWQGLGTAAGAAATVF